MDDYMSQSVLELSPYDDSFPVQLLKEAFECKIEESRSLTERVYRDIISKSAHPISLPEEGKEKIRLTVDFSDEQLQDYQNGVIKLAKEKGHIVAQIRENGRYGSKLPIKEETYIDGPNSLEIQNAAQLQAIQEMLVQITKQIQSIDENVKEILAGQQNDRLGLYYSGVSLYIEANSIHDTEFHKQLMAQSLKSLTDSIFQLTLSLKSDIEYLKRKEYDKEKTRKHNLMCEKVNSIDRGFMAIHQATIMKAAIYCQQGEMQAMVSVLMQYEDFIKKIIACNADMLSQCTVGDNGKLTGTWKRRAHLQLDVAKTIKQLKAADAPIYIEYKEGNKYESN